MEEIRQDLASAWRLFRRSRWFYAGACLTLAVGVGVNGAAFAVLRAVLLQPLPYKDPHRVMMVWRPRVQQPLRTGDLLRPMFARPVPFGRLAYRIHQDGADVLESATYLSWQGNLEAQFDIRLEDRAERLRGALVTANFFDVLGTPAAIGRTITAADETGQPTAIVLSHSLWQRAYGGDPGIVGRPITLLAQRSRVPTVFTVVGVMAPGFKFTYPEDTEAWAILPWRRVDSPTTGFWTVGRLRPSVTREAAQARLAGLSEALQAGLPLEDQDTIRLEPITEWITSATRPSVVLLSGVAVLLLLIACFTVAGALFIRATERQRELVLRSAIGAGRSRLFRQLLTEGMLLSGIAAIGGSGMAWLAAPVLRGLVPTSIPRAHEIGVDTWILGFFAATAALTTIVAVLAPAWRGTRVNLMDALRQSGGAAVDRSGTRWRLTLIAAQSGLAAAMLMLAVLLIASFWRLNAMPLGYERDGVLTVEMRLLSTKYQPVLPPGPPGGPGGMQPSPALMNFQEQLLARVRALPGVAEVGITSAVPFRGVDFTYVLRRAGSSHSVAGKARFVDPGFFAVLRVSAISGRLFTDADAANNPRVMVVSQAYAEAMFGQENPVGQLINSRDGPGTVVGVVTDLRYQSFEADPSPAIYFPIRQAPSELMCLLVRRTPNARHVEASLRAIIRDLDPDLPAMHMTTIDRIVANSVSDRRFHTVATTTLASLALFLTMVGLIVVVTRAVVERRNELAIRMALGATPSRLVGNVLRQGLTSVCLGALAGLSLVWLGSRFVEQFLFRTTSRDWWLNGLVMVAILVTAVMATLLPSRRVTGISSAEVLKGQ